MIRNDDNQLIGHNLLQYKKLASLFNLSTALHTTTRNPSRCLTSPPGSSLRKMAGQDTVASTKMKRWAVPQMCMGVVTVYEVGWSGPSAGDPCRKLMQLGPMNSYDGDFHLQDIPRWLEVDKLRWEACFYLNICVPWHTTGTVVMLILLLLPVTEPTHLGFHVHFQMWILPWIWRN